MKRNAKGVFSQIITGENPNMILKARKITDINEVPEFQAINEKLQKIDLSFNEINEITELLCQKFPNIERLNLSNNKIATFSSNLIFTNIKKLNLSNNQIQIFPPFILELQNLKKLNLSNNSITDIPIQISNLKNLRDINISQNKISRIPFELIHLPALRKLRHESNPLVNPPHYIAERGLNEMKKYISIVNDMKENTKFSCDYPVNDFSTESFISPSISNSVNSEIREKWKKDGKKLEYYMRMGVSEDKGGRSYMEDRYEVSVIPMEEFSLGSVCYVGVYDGHGGSVTVDYILQNLKFYIFEHWKKLIYLKSSKRQSIARIPQSSPDLIIFKTISTNYKPSASLSLSSPSSPASGSSSLSSSPSSPSLSSYTSKNDVSVVVVQENETLNFDCNNHVVDDDNNNNNNNKNQLHSPFQNRSHSHASIELIRGAKKTKSGSLLPTASLSSSTFRRTLDSFSRRYPLPRSRKSPNHHVKSSSSSSLHNQHGDNSVDLSLNPQIHNQETDNDNDNNFSNNNDNAAIVNTEIVKNQSTNNDEEDQVSAGDNNYEEGDADSTVVGEDDGKNKKKSEKKRKKKTKKTPKLRKSLSSEPLSSNQSDHSATDNHDNRDDQNKSNGHHDQSKISQNNDDKENKNDGGDDDVGGDGDDAKEEKFKKIFEMNDEEKRKEFVLLLPEAVKKAFQQIDNELFDLFNKSQLNDGSTVSVGIFVLNKLYIINCGDSRSIVCSKDFVNFASEDHKPNSPSERERIESIGGQVIKVGPIYRLMGSIAISRSLGDFRFRPYLSPEPVIYEFTLYPSIQYIVFASDGLWDRYSNMEVCNTVFEMEPKDSSRYLVTSTKNHQGSDNVTVVVMNLFWDIVD